MMCRAPRRESGDVYEQAVVTILTAGGVWLMLLGGLA